MNAKEGIARLCVNTGGTGEQQKGGIGGSMELKERVLATEGMKN